ncbi:predicted protein [Thalassiosira pseudonana CCMP1335]|uniref:PiggyBac transposable element-derived protein domain-containing protein n=1 Tax=Thalassiosira pseudonana TaxID=35128 RepID=B8C197_THAPS|nr:predicted protein [Thalassiosira pseudonana CCMP1335]EED93204.1 predicted protein [Thalassiosira pseudonana CCMP1335]
MVRKRGGIGAVGKAMARFFHPSKEVEAKCLQEGKTYKSHVLEDAIIIGRETCRINHKNQLAYQCRLPFMDDNKVYAIVCSNMTIVEEGATPFNDEAAATPILRDDSIELRGSQVNASPSVNHDRDTLAADMARLRAEGIEVDTEQPAPENITNEPLLSTTGKWENPRTCPRRADSNIKNSKGCWKCFSWQTIADMDVLAVFRMCMPERYIREVCIPATNVHIVGERLTLPEFYRWLGCRFFMACFVGVCSNENWWSQKPIDQFDGAPFRLNDVMSRSRFRVIDAAIRYTGKPPPSDFEDKFHHMRELQDAFNAHYAENYTPSWLSCLDESMNT